MNKRNLSIIAGILIIIGVVGAIFTYRVHVPQPFSEEKTIDSKNISTVQIQSDNADINIYESNEDHIKVILEGETSTNRKKQFTVDADDSVLAIRYKEKFHSWFHFDFFHVYKPVHLNVYLPEKEYELFEITNVNGEIIVEKQKINDLDVKTTNGDIELNNIRSNKVSVKTSNGDMELKDVAAPNIHVDSVNGSMLLNELEGDITGETTNGNFSVTTKDLNRNIKLKTVNGDMVIRTAQEPKNTEFNVSVVNGDINILDKYSGSAKIGNGENLIELTTTNGDITVEK